MFENKHLLWQKKVSKHKLIVLQTTKNSSKNNFDQICVKNRPLGPL